MSIVVLGSANTDMTVHVPLLPGPGETVLGDRFSTAGGGKGANQAVAAARAGGRVSLIARVGDDAFGRDTRAALEREGIDVGTVVIDREAASGVALIVVGGSGENSIAVASGANARLSPDDVARAAETIRSASLLLMQLEVPLETVEAAARIAREADVPLILDPAPAQPLPTSLLQAVSILTPNQTEAEQLTGVAVADAKGAEQAARRLMQAGADSVLVTLGKAGVVCVREDGVERIDGHAVEVVDSTGAGDVFNGCLAAALAAGHGAREALDFANVGAAISVTRSGAQPAAPRRSQIEAGLANRPKRR